MGFFDIDYNDKAWRDLPVRLRQSIMYAWLKVLVSPVLYVANLFKNYRKANLYDLAHNGQVPYLEAVLNDMFDATARRIFISDPVYYDPIYVYQDNELKPVYVALDSELPVLGYPAPVYAFLDSEVYNGFGVQFVVNVPAALTIDTSQLRALIDKYRLASKNNYTIVNF